MNHQLGVQAITDFCHNLRAINLSNCKKLPGGSVDNIVSSCKHLQDIDLSSTTQQDSPGFPNLEELSLATLESNRIVTSDFVQRFVKNATKLRLTDLRGCISDTVGVMSTLKDIEATDVEQLYLARSQIATCCVLDNILCKWRHSLTHLDLNWKNFIRDTLDEALKQMCDFEGDLKVIELNLGGTNVHMHTIKKVLGKMSKLEQLDLSSCRDLNEGCKREYKSREEINNLRKSLGL